MQFSERCAALWPKFSCGSKKSYYFSFVQPFSCGDIENNILSSLHVGSEIRSVQGIFKVSIINLSIYPSILDYVPPKASFKSDWARTMKAFGIWKVALKLTKICFSLFLALGEMHFSFSLAVGLAHDWIKAQRNVHRNGLACTNLVHQSSFSFLICKMNRKDSEDLGG